MSFLNGLFIDPKYQKAEPRKPEEIDDPHTIISPDTQRENRIPPGQSRTKKWPVLDAYGAPEVDLASWSFEVDGLVEHPQKWSLDEFMQLPAVRVFADFHCVTRWSRLDNVWGGIPTRANTTSLAFGKRAATTCAATPGQRAMVSGSGGHDRQPKCKSGGKPKGKPTFLTSSFSK